MSLLEIKDVTKTFKGLSALENVTAEINEGDIVGLIGPNGAGKTTLFNVITGFFTPDCGQVFFKGEDISGLKPYQICKKGLVRTFQIIKPFQDLTVIENVFAGAFNTVNDRKKATKIALEVLEFVKLADRKDDLAKVLTISELKNLELARALATRPAICLVDEVMSGLNAQEIDEMLETINKVRTEKKITLFVIEHAMRAIMNVSDRIVVLDHGENLAEGTPSEIASNPKVIKSYLGENVET
jgi:branched-chain amino acid transport system ATP-binding protein